MDSSPLASLPAELQDTILHFVLVESEPLIVNNSPSAVVLPGINRTCRGLRERSHEIFFGNNTFTFEVRDCDARRLLAFAAFFGPWLRHGRVEVALTGLEPNWVKLGEWLRFTYDNERRGGPEIVFGRADGPVMECVAQILRRMKERSEEPWDVLKESFGTKFVRFLVLVDQAEIIRGLEQKSDGSRKPYNSL